MVNPYYLNTALGPDDEKHVSLGKRVEACTIDPLPMFSSHIQKEKKSRAQHDAAGCKFQYISSVISRILYLSDVILSANIAELYVKPTI